MQVVRGDVGVWLQGFKWVRGCRCMATGVGKWKGADIGVCLNISVFSLHRIRFYTFMCLYIHIYIYIYIYVFKLSERAFTHFI